MEDKKLSTIRVMRIAKIHQDAIVPAYATMGSACFDLHSVDEGTLTEDRTSIVYKTGLKFEVPEGYAMLIFSRSGHGFNSDVRLANCVGVIDSDYRGAVMVKLTLDAIKSFPVVKGDRIAQAGLFEVTQFGFAVVEESVLSVTERGEGGLGSSGTGRKFFGQPNGPSF